MIKTLEETQLYAKELLGSLTPVTYATILALEGDLGAGKTTFTQSIARALGVTSEVTSPTFVIQKIYELEGQVFDRLIHIDAYRFENPEEVETIGWKEIIMNPKNLIVVEWPEKIGTALPETAQTITFKTVSETERDITLVK